MLERGPQIDREASEAIKRIETQMRLDGKLRKVDALEGASYLFAPLVLLVVGIIGWMLKSLGLEGPGMVMVAVLLAVYLKCRQ